MSKYTTYVGMDMRKIPGRVSSNLNLYMKIRAGSFFGNRHVPLAHGYLDSASNFDSSLGVLVFLRIESRHEYRVVFPLGRATDELSHWPSMREILRCQKRGEMTHITRLCG